MNAVAQHNHREDKMDKGHVAFDATISMGADPLGCIGQCKHAFDLPSSLLISRLDRLTVTIASTVASIRVTPCGRWD